MKLVLSKIKLFIDNNGKCKIFQSDNGKEFYNAELKIFCENNDINFIKSSPYHPQTNGQVEAIHKQESEFLFKQKKLLKNNFDLEISLEEFIVYHNSKKNSITKFTLLDIRDVEKLETIDTVTTNIISSLYKKIYKNDNLRKGCYVLLSNKIEKTRKTFKAKIIKESMNLEYLVYSKIFQIIILLILLLILIIKNFSKKK